LEDGEGGAVSERSSEDFAAKWLDTSEPGAWIGMLFVSMVIVDWCPYRKFSYLLPVGKRHPIHCIALYTI
jgi:hypothetical protein